VTAALLSAAVHPSFHKQESKTMTDKNTPIRGTVEEFDILHRKLVAAYEKELDRCIAAGEAPSPAFLSTLRQFLKDNGVDSPARVSKLDRLAGQLPTDDELTQMMGGNVVPLPRGK
jgi:hypothetical protein